MDSAQYKQLLLNTLSQTKYVRGIPVEGSYPEQYDTDLPIVHITSIEDIQGIGTQYPTRCYFAQVQNIDASGFNYKPVDLIEGHYNGAGFSINNLSINQTDLSEDEDIYASLFKNASLATIEDVHLVNFNTSSIVSSGIASNLIHSNILNCTVDGNFNLTFIGSGVANTSYFSNIINCNIHTYSDSTALSFAGILHQGNNNLIVGCSWTGEINSENATGIMFGSEGAENKIRQSYTDGTFYAFEYDTTEEKTASGVYSSGGKAIIEDCYSTVQMLGFDYTSGLIYSTENGVLRRCYTDSTIYIKDAEGTIVDDVYTSNLTECATFANWDLENIWECNDGNPPTLRIIEDYELSEPVIMDISDYESFQGILPGNSYRLTVDLNFNGINFKPVDLTNGYFDGGNHTITNLTIDSTNDHVGLFSRASVIKDTTIRDSFISGKNYTGGIVGESLINSGIVLNSNVLNTAITGMEYTGGITGYSNGIIDCEFDGSVSGTNYVGGVTGRATIVKHSNSVGNILGVNHVGGIVGSGSCIKSYSMGDVEGYYRVGGCVGSGGTQIDCFSRGNVTGNEEVGGFIGRYTGTFLVLLKRCYCAGAVTGNTHVNAFLGRKSLLSGSNIIECYYNNNLTSYSDSYAIGVPSSEMLCPNTWGWDFVNTWVCNTGFYPSLRKTPALIIDTNDLPFDITMTIRVLNIDYPGYLINEWLENRDIFIYTHPYTQRLMISKHDYSSPLMEQNFVSFMPWGVQGFYMTPKIKNGWVIRNGRIINLAGEQLISLYSKIQSKRVEIKNYEIAIQAAEGDTTELESELADVQDRLNYFKSEFIRVYNEDSRKLPQEERMYLNIIN